ncbi:FAD binding domain-containing protein [Brevibacterium sediminis]|uniref:FAD binding domain-containing protein n=1 Tax=Brevibacterium sediminis TaxID=1857024 RepID=UPI0021752FFB|nr:FAD binding domain-containing protein [Brevibacterium sediminis]MCS4593873.1 FAD binding domain-containing protein [Brevibacterium sediminis]
MDMTCVDEVLFSADPDHWRPGDRWLAGGTVLLSYGTDITRGAPMRLLDITEAGWEPTIWHATELEIAATCRIADIFAFTSGSNRPAPHSVLPGLDLFAPCCDSFVASWKIWNVSTIGGNVATALPAGPMTSLLAGLDAQALLIGPGGSRRRLPVAQLVRGEARTDLGEGELIRSFHIPLTSLAQRCAFRRISLTERGRSAALLIGRLLEVDRVRITITASTRRPIIIDLGRATGYDLTPSALHAAIESAVAGDWHDDIHGSPRWREAMTHRLGEEILTELLAADDSTADFRVSGDITMTRSER